MKKDYLNNVNVQNLIESIINGECAIFVGAGVSISAGGRSWDELNKEISNYTGLNEECPVLRSLEICKIINGPVEFFRKFESLIKLPHTTTSILHELLADLPVKHFITTNYDTLLEDVLREKRGDNNVYVFKRNDRNLCYIQNKYKNNTLVVKIHGCISQIKENNFDFIIGESDYLNFNENNPFIMEYLSSIFKANSVLFIGYSLKDWHILQMLHALRKVTGGISPSKYYIGINANSYSEYLNNIGLKVINIEKGNSIQTTTLNIASFLKAILERILIPDWFFYIMKDCDMPIYRKDKNQYVRDLISNFDVTCLTRLGLRLEDKLTKICNKKVTIPLDQLLDPNLTIGSLIKIIEDNCKLDLTVLSKKYINS